MKESSRGLHNVHCATSVKQADDIMREHEVGVAVIDAALVGQQVEQLMGRSPWADAPPRATPPTVPLLLPRGTTSRPPRGVRPQSLR